MSDEEETVNTAMKIIQMAVVHPGDVLVVALPEDAGAKQVADFSATLRGLLPDTVTAVVVGGQLHAWVMRAGTEAADDH